MQNEIDPKTKKVIWNIILYIVTALAGLFSGDAVKTFLNL